jgi:hypothetical protein
MSAVNAAVRMQSLEYKYEKTGDITYLVLAIGKHWSDPPNWAITEALKFYDQHERFVDTNTNKPLGRYEKIDGELLDRVADAFIKLRRDLKRKDVFRTAVVRAMGDEFDETIYRRLERIWKKDSKRFMSDSIWNRWISRAYLRKNFHSTWANIPPPSCNVCGSSMIDDALPEFSLEVRLDPDEENYDAVRNFLLCGPACVAKAAAQFRTDEGSE